jgi:outer membrane protein TolC
MIRNALATVLLCMAGAPLAAQPPSQPTGPPLQLADLTKAAVATDPRTREIALLAEQSALRVRNIAASWLPSVNAEAQAQHQSDVAVAPFTNAAGQPLFAAPKTTYDSYLRVEQRLVDRTIGAQAAVERAQLAEQQARVMVAVFSVRQQVNDAFFAAASLQQRAAVAAASVADLEGRRRDIEARVQEGAALPADAAVIEATLLQRRQELDQAESSQRAARARLATITGREISESARLELPDLTEAANDARRTGDAGQARPEYAQFARTRDRIARQRDTVAAQTRPRVSAYARLGYGKPGLNFVGDAFDTYALGGVRVQWSAWTWGMPAREREALALQQQIADADQAAFAKSIAVASQTDPANIDRLQRALEADRRIVELRLQVEQSAQARLREAVMTAADYLARNTELLQARYALAAHEVELAEAQARLLTTLGLEVR